jgi:hypothetical protein
VARRLPDLIEAYLEYTKNTESPLSYHLWSGIAVVASAMERKVYMKWGHSEIFPNLYIVLIGPSGARKGEPLMIARDILESVSVNTIAEAITKQALIKRIKDSIGQFDDQGQLVMQCAVTVVAEELAIFLGEGDSGFLADLTNWYDARSKWTYETKHAGTDEILGVCVNILASMAPDWIPLSIPQGAIGGGFTSRLIFVVESRKGRNISNPNLHKIDKALLEDIRADLERVKQLVGEITFDPKALAAYEKWYVREEERASSGRPPLTDPRFAGYVARRATHVKKVSMVVSAARSDSLVIIEEDFDRALRLMETTERTMQDVFGKVGRAAYVGQTQEIMNFIRRNSPTTRSAVMQAFYRDVDGKVIEIVESTMRATMFVKIGLDTQTGDTTYVWVG